MSRLEKIGAHIIFWIIFTLALTNLGFALGININSWSLPASYLIYISSLLFLTIKNKEKINLLSITIVILLPIFLLILAWLFGFTFDSSYDGQAYHQSAVIALSEGWNPWRDTILPINIPEGAPFVIGYPKALWIFQSGIYKLLPQHLNSATITNLIVAMLASIFVYGLLTRLKLSKFWAVIITTLAVLQTTLIQEFFTFMADGLSYELALIAITSLAIFIINKDKKWPLMVFLSSEILLVGTKYSNLLVFGLLGFIFLFYLLKIVFYNADLIKPIVYLSIAGVIILWSPYGVNLVRYKSPIYPSNLDWAKEDLTYQNTPKNLKQANKISLLFYGIYSKAQYASSPESNENIAQLKIPFTTSFDELNITNNFQGRVGSEGVFFSGLFSLSILVYLFLFLSKKKSYSRKMFSILTLVLGLTFVAALMNPTPNKLRYVPEFSLVPIYVLVSLLLIFKSNKSIWVQSGISILALLIYANMVLKLVPSAYARIDETQIATSEMDLMRDSNITYEVKAKSFYSSYVRLKEYAVNFVEVEKLSCNNVQPLQLSNFTTFYCP